MDLWKLSANSAEHLWEKTEGYAQAITFTPGGKQVESLENDSSGFGKGVLTIHDLQGKRLHRWMFLPTGPTELIFTPTADTC